MTAGLEQSREDQQPSAASSMPSPKPFRPPLAFRVGVTGAIKLEQTMHAAIEAAVGDVLDVVTRICGDVAATASARAVYATSVSGEAAGTVVVSRAILSPLARGSDQIVAQAALARGYRLSVPMPFPRPIYGADFPDESRTGFDRLVASADGRVLEIDGARADDNTWRSYEAVGRMVARNCDLLIAIWDETAPPNGPGGTGDTVHFALRSGVPVWWIHPSGSRRPALVTRLDELAHPRADGACYALGELIKTQLTPPPPSDTEASGVLYGLRMAGSGVAVAIGRKSHAHDDSLQRFLTDEELLSSRRWNAHEFVMHLLAKVPAGPPTKDSPPLGYWGQVYAAPDRLSKVYAVRYRSAYVYVIVLAALALSCPAFASFFDTSQQAAQIVFGIAELAFITIVFGIVLAAQNGRWHERWIASRLLAELCRKQSALALLGWSLPITDASAATESESQESAWVSWYYGAVARAAPLATGSLSGASLVDIRGKITDLLITDQIRYHRRRATENRLAAAKLLRVGETCFLLALIVVLLKVVIIFRGGSTTVPNVLAGVLSVITASILTLRSYAELDVIAHHSSRTAAHLELVRDRIEAAAMTQPLASQALGHDLSRGIAAMLTDVTGWAQLFRMKGIEAG